MDRCRLIFLQNLEETLALGEQIASSLSPNMILALTGDLGAGKTSFVQGLARGLKISDPVQSPTFVTLNIYEGKLYHFDLYRLKSENEFLQMGFSEYFDMPGIKAIEWPERISSLIPKDALWISFTREADGRLATIKQGGKP
jgi:tRNA threonylcarbamoyladenosine biosynthesis protein TsaE